MRAQQLGVSAFEGTSELIVSMCLTALFHHHHREAPVLYRWLFLHAAAACLPACPCAGWELEYVTSTTFMGDAALPAASWPFDKSAAIVAASVLDCVGVGLYFIVTLGLIVLARRRAEDADVHTVTIHDYSVYVRNLPPDASSTELVDFFSQWGEVSRHSAT